MKIPLSSIGVFLILSGGAPPLSAHEINVHWRISASAAQGSTGLQKFLGEVLSAGESGSLSDPADPSESPKSSIGWIQYGSGREDDLNVLPDAGGLRVMNHFYDPITRKGLSELPIFAAVPTASGPYELGTNSYIWASVLNSPGVKIKPLFLRLIPQPPHTENDWSWQNARNFEYLALTSQWQTDRDKDLARTFRALGQVIHLLQDASQPQHTRNEQHLPILPLWKSPIETYGSENIGQLKFSPTPSALDWRAAGFQKMEDFWDRHSYAPIPGVTPSVVALEGDPGSGNPGPGTLGLAEFVNGNFLGARHVYRELMTRGITGYYEYPSLNDGTDWLQIKAHPADYKNIGTIPRKIGSVNRFSIWKNAQGAQVVNHSASHFLPAIGRNNPGAGPVLTIDDPEVKKNYHDILIPKAVQYSAGLLDYFFRGRMEVWMGASSTPGNNSLRIVNNSGGPLQMGTFQLFYDDATGMRTEITPPNFTTYGTTLADGGMITAEFTRPTPPGGTVAGYILVYKGTIGVNGTTVIDPVDSNIAVIARRIAMDCDASAGEAIDANLFNGGAWIPEGSIVAVVDETARVTKQAGHYRRSYVSGHATVFTPRLCNNISSPCGNCSETDIYTTDTWSNGVLERQTRCPESCSSDNSPMTADASRVEQNTPRPIIDFDFNLAGRFGPLVAEIAVCDHNGPEKATQEGGTFDPGSITYSLQRLRFPQIDQSASIMVVKLKDFAAIAPSLLSFLTCQSCGNNSPFAAWDGTIPRDDFDPTGGYIGFDTNPNISLNQSGVSASVWTDSGRWGLEISCKTSGGSSVTLWQGFKTTGYTPTGTYGVDGNAGTRGCAADAISCITLE